MKHFLLLLAGLSFSVWAAAPKAGHTIIIRDGHANALYRLGEEAVFTLTVSGKVDRAFSSDGTVKVIMDHFGGKRILERTWDPEKEPTLTLKGTRTEPGFLRVQAVTKDTHDLWAIGEGNACWSVGYEPTRIVGSTPYPDDFASYWHGELDRLDATVPVDFRREPDAALSKGAWDVSRVSVATFGGERIWGFLIVPKKRSTEKLPLVIRIAGAGPAYCGANVREFEKPDEIALIMNVHRYAPVAAYKDQQKLYEALNGDYRTRYGGVINYSTGGAGVSREALYFHDAIVGLVRLSNQVVARPDVDRSRVLYTGGSQGSGMGLALTALNPAICRGFFRVPALSDLCGFRKGRQSGWPQLIERQPDEKSRATAERVAQYYDAVNFAHLVKVPVRIVVGFADNCCPPYGGYSVFNALPSADKGIANGLGMWHVTAPEFERRGETWLRKGTDGETTAGWENVDPARCEFPPSKVVWTAPQSGWTVEREGGAEGAVDFTNGTVVIRKTSEKGRIVVTAPGFPVEKGRILRFFADVSGRTEFPNGAMGYLATWSRTRKITCFDAVSMKHWWFGLGGVHMTQILNSAPGMTWRKYHHLDPDGDEAHVAIVIEGHASESVWKGLAAEDFDAAQESWNGHFERMNLQDRSQDLSPEDEFERKLAADTDHTARIVTKDGVSYLEVDGRVVPPIVYKTPGHIGVKQADRMCYAGKPLQRAGVRIGVAQCRFGDLPEYPGFWTKRGFDVRGAVRAIGDQMRAGDESLFILTLNVTAYPEFTTEEHPDEVWLNEDGTAPLGNSGSVIPDKYNDGGLADPNERRWPWASPASPSWRKAVKERVAELFAELRRTGLMKRVIGVHFAGYHDTQFAMPIPDFSPAAKADYARYLAENGLRPSDREGSYAFYSKQMGWRVIEDLSRAAKGLAGKPILASRWVMSPFSISFDMTSFVKSDAVDIIVPQPEYSMRLPGLPQGIRLPAESFHRHGKMQWFEFDLRTYAACDIWAKSIIAAKGLNTAQDIGMWRTLFRKHAGILAAHRMGWWFYDMAGGWFSPDEIVDDVANVRQLRQQLDAEPVDPWRPDVAFVVDESAMATYGTKDGPKVPQRETLANEQWSESALAGVPYDAWLAQDFYDDPSLARRYKAVVWSGFCAPDARQKKLMDDVAAMGVKSFVVQPGGFKGAFLHAFAREADAFVACPPDRMQVDMNGNFLSLHCIVPGTCDVRLPFEAIVTNLKDGSAFSGAVLKVSMTAGETCWFSLRRRLK